MCSECYKSPEERFRTSFLEKPLKWSLEGWIKILRWRKGRGLVSPADVTKYKQVNITRALHKNQCEVNPSLVLSNFCERQGEETIRNNFFKWNKIWNWYILLLLNKYHVNFSVSMCVLHGVTRYDGRPALLPLLGGWARDFTLQLNPIKLHS